MLGVFILVILVISVHSHFIQKSDGESEQS